MSIVFDQFHAVTQEALENLGETQARKFLVAYSGGLDSTCLLTLFHQWREIDPSIQLRAIHVNHQLQSLAEQWQAHCEKQCKDLSINCISQTVEVETSKRESVESAARHARYAAIKSHLQADEIVVTAHHKDDQVETLLLRLLRGTGIEGAAAMQNLKPFANSYIFRPLLNLTRKELEQFASTHNLHWIDDPSNCNTQMDRNFLRNDVLPLIATRWPTYAESLSRFSRHAASAAELLRDCIAEDYQRCMQANQLSCDALQNISETRQKAIVRAWFADNSQQPPSEKQLDSIIQIIQARQDAKPVVRCGNIELRRYQNRFYFLAPITPFDTSLKLDWDTSKSLEIAGAGILRCEREMQTLLPTTLKVVFRQGGEVCHIPGRGGGHSLKKLFQESGVPPWLRDRTPILLAGDKIVAVAGIFCSDPHMRIYWQYQLE